MPAIISWPGKLPENEVRDQLGTGCDWYPTLLELCGVKPSGHKLDGRSLVPIIKSAEGKTRHEMFHWKSGRSIAVREGRWKLIMTGNKMELYDLPADLGEAKNLATSQAKVVERLKNASSAYWRSVQSK